MSFDSVHFFRYEVLSALGNESDDEKGIRELVDNADVCEWTRSRYDEALSKILGSSDISCKDLLYETTNREAHSEVEARRWFMDLRERIFGVPTPVQWLRHRLLAPIENEPDNELAFRIMRQIVDRDDESRSLCEKGFQRILGDPRFPCEELLFSWARRELGTEQEARRWLTELRDRLLSPGRS